MTVDEEQGLDRKGLPEALRWCRHGLGSWLYCRCPELRPNRSLSSGAADRFRDSRDKRDMQPTSGSTRRALSGPVPPRKRCLPGRYAEAIAAFENLLSRLPEPGSPAAVVFGRRKRAARPACGAARQSWESPSCGTNASTRPSPRPGGAIEYWPARSKHHHNLGLALFRARRYDEAVAALQKVGVVAGSLPPAFVTTWGGRSSPRSVASEAEIELEAELAVYAAAGSMRVATPKPCTC